MEEEYFEKLNEVTDKLIRTFEDNAVYFDTYGMKDEMYIWSIVDIEDIKENLDAEVAKHIKKTEEDELIAPYLVERFNKLMLDNHAKWEDENEIKIAELVSQFIRTEFKEPMAKTMKQYLQEKYGSQGRGLIRDIADKVIGEKVVAQSAPVFHSDPMVVQLSAPGRDHIEEMILFVPNDEEDVKVAAEQYNPPSGARMTTVTSAITDGICIFRIFRGIPLVAYDELKNMERMYNEFPTPGMHLYEGQDNNWINLPSPIPATYEDSRYERVQPSQDKVNHIIELYDKAKGAGIIAEDWSSMSATIFTTLKCDLNVIFEGTLPKEGIDMIGDIISLPKERREARIVDMIAANLWRSDCSTTNMAMIKINDYIQSYRGPYEATEKLYACNKMEKNGKYTNGFDSSIRDDFVMKPIFVKLVQDELDKIDILHAASGVVTTIFEQLKEAGDQKSGFFRALLHSVIFRYRSNYKFNFEKCGEVTEVVLTRAFEEYEMIPVYRAFVSYTKLDAEILEQIGEKTSKAAKNITDEMYDNVKDFQEFYKDSYSDYKKAAGTFENNDQIISFLEMLYDEIKWFLEKNK